VLFNREYSRVCSIIIVNKEHSFVESFLLDFSSAFYSVAMVWFSHDSTVTTRYMLFLLFIIVFVFL